MNRLRWLSVWSFGFATSLCLTASGQEKQWVKLQGQVILNKSAKLPEPKELNVSQDKDHCLKDGPIKADDVLVNPKNRGLKNVWVYLRPNNKEPNAKLTSEDIKPSLQKPEPRTHDVDQPACMFVPRIFAIREGDFVNFKNSSPIAHNTKLDAVAPSPSYNKTIAAGGSYKDPKPFMADRFPIAFSCSIHPWMGGKFMVFDHPYFAVTDADGKFTIPDAPAGKYRIVYHHEHGYHKGREGRYGVEIEIKPDAQGVMELPPFEFEFPEKK